MEEWNRQAFRALWYFSRRWDILDKIGIFLADYFPWILGLVLLWYIFKFFHGRRLQLFVLSEIFLAVIVSRGMITEAIRYFMPAQRPFEFYGLTPLVLENSSSFPSGHAALMFAVAGIILCLQPKRGIWFVLASVATAVARVYCGVHWPGDVIVGALIGLATAYVIHLLTRGLYLQLQKKHQPVEIPESSKPAQI